MAERRMFAMTIIDSDVFTDMPLSTQALYFHLSMRGDDDGFINNPKKIQKMIGSTEDDLKLLTAKNFIIPFDSGVVVIKHWKIHNYIRKDRYKATVYQEELSQLITKENDSYTFGQPNDNQMLPNGSIGKDRLGKDSIGKEIHTTEVDLSLEDENKGKNTKKIYGEYKHIKLTEVDTSKLKEKLGEELTNQCIKYLDEYIEMKGYKAKNHYLCILKWVKSAVEKDKSINDTAYSVPVYTPSAHKELSKAELEELNSFLGGNYGEKN